MTPDEQKLSDEAYSWIRKHEKELIDKFCGSCMKVATPVSLFLAGSPGAGKTEVSKGLMRQFETMPVRIDADEIREICPGYTGSNAHIFQKAATKGVQMLQDHALHNDLHMILDGTFAYGKALENIKRSLDKGRKVELWYVYQDPVKAWEFTKAREALESRRVSKSLFIQAFLKSMENTKEAKDIYGSSLTLNLLIKNIDNSDGELSLNIPSDQLDAHIGKTYTADDLAPILV